MSLDLVAVDPPAEVANTLAESFRAEHGRDPDVVGMAPGRVNLIGEHVDYNGGRCLPLALPYGTYVAASARPDRTVTLRSVQRSDGFSGSLDALGPGQVDGWTAYAAGVLWALGEAGTELPGMDLVVDGRVPIGSGLSSSAALECSVGLAAMQLAGVADTARTRAALIEAAVRAERDVAGAPTGGMDQTVALLAEARRATLIDTRDGSTSQVPWEPEAYGVELVVVDTRVSHSLSDGGYAARRADCESAAKQLGVAVLRDVTDAESALASLDDERLVRRTRHVLSEIARVDAVVDCLNEGDLERVGQLFVESHASLRDDYEVSCAELDAVVDAALAHGALGARMTGGGFGGCAIALVGHDDVAAVRDGVEAAFDKHGWQPPRLLHAEASPSARLLR